MVQGRHLIWAKTLSYLATQYYRCQEWADWKVIGDNLEGDLNLVHSPKKLSHALAAILSPASASATSATSVTTATSALSQAALARSY